MFVLDEMPVRPFNIKEQMITLLNRCWQQFYNPSDKNQQITLMTTSRNT